MRIPARTIAVAIAGPALALSGLATTSASAKPSPEVTTHVVLVKGDASWKARFDWRRGYVYSYGTIADACRNDRTGSVRVVFSSRTSDGKNPAADFQTNKACRSRDLGFTVSSPTYGVKVTGVQIQVCNMVRGKATTCAKKLFDNPTV